MPDDLWGYCGTCHKIHARDEDGFLCDDPSYPSTVDRGISAQAAQAALLVLCTV